LNALGKKKSRALCGVEVSPESSKGFERAAGNRGELWSTLETGRRFRIQRKVRFDAVLCYDVFEHLFASRWCFLREIRRVLKPDGRRFCCAFPNTLNGFQPLGPSRSATYGRQSWTRSHRTTELFFESHTTVLKGPFLSVFPRRWELPPCVVNGISIFRRNSRIRRSVFPGSFRKRPSRSRGLPQLLPSIFGARVFCTCAKKAKKLRLRG